MAHSWAIPRATRLDSAARAPLAASASWWLAHGLDLTARVAWGAAAWTADRGADAFDGTIGLRWGASGGALRPSLVADLGARHAAPPAGPGETALLARCGAEVDAFVARDVALGVMATLALEIAGGGASPESGLALRLELYF